MPREALRPTSSPSMRRLFLRDLLILLLLVSGAILALFLWGGRQVRQEVSRHLISATVIKAEEDFRSFFSPLEAGLTLVRQWGESGLVDLEDIPAMNAKFIPLLEQTPHIAAMMIASSAGAEYFLTRDGDLWRTRSTRIGDAARTYRWQQWAREGALVKSWNEDLAYDPRDRPWFRGAAQGGEPGVFWTGPYRFFTAEAQGLTGSVGWQSAKGGDTTFVTGFDVLISDLIELTSNLRVGQSGRVFLLTGEGQFLGAPPEEGVSGISAELVEQAVGKWNDSDRAANEPLEFSFAKKRWWAAFRPLNAERRAVWLGVAQPESDYLGMLDSRRNLVLVIALAILIVAVVLAVALVRKYGRQLRDLPRAVLKEEDAASGVNALIAGGESPSVEFKSTMRMNLKSGKVGKEIELAWLKTVVAFLNSEGGTLLLGVADHGEILGLDADNFPNEDRCRLHFKNLISQHVGMEFSRYIHFDLCPMGVKTVAVVECERAPEPAFLKNGQDEDFYIRSGPASIKLTPSKILTYLKQRK